jgi:TonB family protein
MEKYFAMLRERLLKALDKPPGLSDTLVAEAEVRLNADGSIAGVKIISPSGSAEFDRAVLEAFGRVRMPARPDGKSSVHSLKFQTKDLEGR